MKIHFPSLQHFIKFKKSFEKNHFLHNQVTADLALLEKKQYDKLKQKIRSFETKKSYPEVNKRPPEAGRWRTKAKTL